MRILLLGDYANDRLESMDLFVAALARELRARGLEVRVLRPPVVFGRLRRSGAGWGKWLGYLDKYLLFPWTLGAQTRSRARDLVVHICDHSSALYTHCLARVPHLVTCHDLLAIRSARGEFPENPTGWTGRCYQRWILGGLRRAWRIASVSRATAEDVQRLTARPAARDLVIPNSLHFSYTPMDAPARAHILAALDPRLLAERYLLHVGGNQWYKNRLGVARIFQQLRQRGAMRPALVFAGQEPAAEVAAFLRAHGLNDAVISLGRCSTEQLRALYSGAAALLFPSLAEGFGWPIIEAQACGCPVVTTAREPMSAVGGAAALTIDPANPIAAAEGLEKLLAEAPEARARRVQAGLQNAAQYAPGRMAGEYVRAYREALSAFPA